MGHREVAVVRTVNTTTALMAVSSVVSAAMVNDRCRTLVLIDASDMGMHDRINDVLNMAKQLGWEVYIQRTKKEGYHRDFVKGLRFAKRLGATRVHHFDDDVVVLPHWFQADWHPDFVGATQVMESASFKGFDVERSPGFTHHVAAHAMSIPGKLIREKVLKVVERHELSIFEDMRFCQASGDKAHVVEGVGVCHSARDTGQSYIRTMILAYATGVLVTRDAR